MPQTSWPGLARPSPKRKPVDPRVKPRDAGVENALRQRFGAGVAAPGAHLDRRSETVHHDGLGPDREGAGDTVLHLIFAVDRDALGAKGAAPGGEIRVGEAGAFHKRPLGIT